MFILDGDNVVGEVQQDSVTATYLRGANLIRKKVGSTLTYYQFNAHGDVVDLTNTSGSSIQSYAYDAFGVEQYPDLYDTNAFRYCGEYYDTETGTYYLRARYYNPRIGRFTARDAHWTSVNAIYGDNPQKINERQDKLGLSYYAYAPQISAVMQAGNLYVYCMGNPVRYVDETGEASTINLMDPDNAAKGLFYAGSGGTGVFTLWGLYQLYQSSKNLVIRITRKTGSNDSLFRSKSSDTKDTENKGINTKKKNDINPPQIKYPGDDPTKAPDENYEWRGLEPVGGENGTWVNLKTNEQLHSDLNHKNQLDRTGIIRMGKSQKCGGEFIRIRWK